jgi:hypothetical protein
MLQIKNYFFSLTDVMNLDLIHFLCLLIISLNLDLIHFLCLLIISYNFLQLSCILKKRNYVICADGKLIL